MIFKNTYHTEGFPAIYEYESKHYGKVWIMPEAQEWCFESENNDPLEPTITGFQTARWMNWDAFTECRAQNFEIHGECTIPWVVFSLTHFSLVNNGDSLPMETVPLPFVRNELRITREAIPRKEFAAYFSKHRGTFNIVVDIFDLLNHNIEDLNELTDEIICPSGIMLSDISYRVVGVFPDVYTDGKDDLVSDEIVIEVTAGGFEEFDTFDDEDGVDE